MKCPIGLGTVHCRNCCFWRDDLCDYDKIMQEFELASARKRELAKAKKPELAMAKKRELPWPLLEKT